MARDGEHSWKRALLTGLAIAAAPIVGLNALLAFNTVTTVQRDVDGIAAETLSLAEARLDDAATMLISLGLKGVNGCSPADVAALQAASQRVGVVAETAVLDGSGAGLCAAFGSPRVVRRVSPEHGTISPDVMLSMVSIGGSNGAQSIRLQWRNPDGSSIRVLIPGDDIFPYFLRSRMSAAFVAQAVMVDGAAITRKVTDPSLTQERTSFVPAITATATSTRYPLKIDVTAPGSALVTANAGLFVYANLGGLVFAALACTIAIVVSRRSGGPIRGIADGIRKGEFVPYYQPVIDITSGRLTGCEALVRWVKPDGRVIPPGRFISLAEASGEIFPMTRALMEAARNDLIDLYADRPNLKLGFNLCAGHFDDVGIVDDVTRIFGGSAIALTQLMFEVTERQPLQDVRHAKLVIARLQALGARVALDDVGTGHGGLSYLLKLGVDVMKMDKMFVDAIGTDRYSIAIVDSLVKLADDMNLDLIAEGVETFEQVEYLRAKGVRMAQGYVFAPPLPAASFRALVEAMTPLGREARRQPRASIGQARTAAA